MVSRARRAASPSRPACMLSAPQHGWPGGTTTSQPSADNTRWSRPAPRCSPSTRDPRSWSANGTVTGRSSSSSSRSTRRAPGTSRPSTRGPSRCGRPRRRPTPCWSPGSRCRRDVPEQPQLQVMARSGHIVAATRAACSNSAGTSPGSVTAYPSSLRSNTSGPTAQQAPCPRQRSSSTPVLLGHAEQIGDDEQGEGVGELADALALRTGQEGVQHPVGDLPDGRLVLLEALRCDQPHQQPAVRGVRGWVEGRQRVAHRQLVAVSLDEFADVVTFHRDREAPEGARHRQARRERPGVLCHLHGLVVPGHHHHTVVGLAGHGAPGRAGRPGRDTGPAPCCRPGRSRSCQGPRTARHAPLAGFFRGAEAARRFLLVCENLILALSDC